MKLVLILLITVIIYILYLIYNMYRKREYYFDNNATTIYIEQDIRDIINNWIDCGNPSNTLHEEGKRARKKNEESKEIIATDLQVDSSEIYFTSNATEANNIAIQSIINYYLQTNEFDKFTIMTSNTEHPSVLEVFKKYNDHPRIEVIFIPIETNIKNKYYGSINPESVMKLIKKSTHKVILMSFMYANNETGALNDVKALGEISKKYQIIFHCDCTQAIGKYIIHPRDLNIHSITFSGHKIHTPKGVGCLYMQNKIIFEDAQLISDVGNLQTVKNQKCNDLDSKDLHGICFGGEQSLLRPGTENVAYNAALACALKKIHERRNDKNAKLFKQKQYIIQELMNLNCKIIQSNYDNLANTILVILTGIDCCNKTFARELSNLFGISVGTNSACHSQDKSSYVVSAMKIKPELQDKIIRISLSDYTTDNECKYLIRSLKDLLSKHRKTPKFNQENIYYQ